MSGFWGVSCFCGRLLAVLSLRAYYFWPKNQAANNPGLGGVLMAQKQ